MAMMDVRTAFIELRRRLKVSQREIAPSFGIQASNLSNIETGLRNPTQKTLQLAWDFASAHSQHDLAEVFESAIKQSIPATSYRDSELTKLRDQFAMAALPSLMKLEHLQRGEDYLAHWAYVVADGMLKERSRDRKA